MLFDVNEENNRELKFNQRTMEFIQSTFDSGKGYEYLNKQLRIVLSNVDHQVREKLREDDIGQQLRIGEFVTFANTAYIDALKSVEDLMFVAAEPSTVIKCKFKFMLLYNLQRYQIQV